MSLLDRHPTLLLAMTALAIAIAASPAHAAPHVASPRGPGEGSWAIGASAAAMVAEDLAIPFVRLEAAAGVSESVDVVGELDTIGLATMMVAGPRLHLGDRVAVAVSLRGGPGLLVLPEFFGRTEVQPMLVGVPGASLGVTWDGGALTTAADLLLFIGPEVGSASARVSATLELDVAHVGALSMSGALVLDGGEDRVLPVAAVGWVW